jgi:type I restriction enzyme S subunit
MARWVNGIAFKDIQFTASGRPVIKIAEIKGGISGQTKFTEQEFDESVRVRPGDLLFSWSGQPETSIDAFWWRGPEGWLNQHVFRVTPEEGIHTVFFYYLLRYLKPNFIGIARNKQTTGLGHVTKRDLENLRGAYPELPEQRAIAHILGTLDDKIELNRQMSATLEAMARALFKSWFVDFEPVRAKAEGRDPGLPPHLAALFSDQIVETENVEIPMGWDRIPLLDLANWDNGAAYKNMHFSDSAVALPVVKIAELKAGVSSQTKRTATDLGDKYRIGSRDLLFSWSGNPDTSIDAFIWIGGEAWLNQHIFAVRENGRRSKAHLFILLRHLKPEFTRIASNKQTTGLGHVTKADMQNLLVAEPPIALLVAFERLISPIFDRLVSTLIEIQTLTAVRDTLLPELISGETRLKGAETFLDRVL